MEVTRWEGLAGRGVFKFEVWTGSIKDSECCTSLYGWPDMPQQLLKITWAQTLRGMRLARSIRLMTSRLRPAPPADERRNGDRHEGDDCPGDPAPSGNPPPGCVCGGGQALQVGRCVFLRSKCVSQRVAPHLHWLIVRPAYSNGPPLSIR